MFRKLDCLLWQNRQNGYRSIPGRCHARIAREDHILFDLFPISRFVPDVFTERADGNNPASTFLSASEPGDCGLRNADFLKHGGLPIWISCNQHSFLPYSAIRNPQSLDSLDSPDYTFFVRLLAVDFGSKNIG